MGNSDLLMNPQSDAAVATGKAIGSYSIHAISEDATYKYYFFENSAENWYVLRKHKANKTYSYARGSGGADSVYQNPTSGPGGTPTWGSYGEIF